MINNVSNLTWGHSCLASYIKDTLKPVHRVWNILVDVLKIYYVKLLEYIRTTTHHKPKAYNKYNPLNNFVFIPWHAEQQKALLAITSVTEQF